MGRERVARYEVWLEGSWRVSGCTQATMWLVHSPHPSFSNCSQDVEDACRKGRSSGQERHLLLPNYPVASRALSPATCVPFPFPKPDPEQGIPTITYLTSPVCQLKPPPGGRLLLLLPYCCSCSAFLHGSCAYRLPYPTLPMAKRADFRLFQDPRATVWLRSLITYPGKRGIEVGRR